MRALRLLQILFSIFIIQLYACKPHAVPRTKPHTLIVLELDTAGFYKQPAASSTANIRHLSEKAADVIMQRLIKLGIDERNFELSEEMNLITLKLWQPPNNSLPIDNILKVLQAKGKLEFWNVYDTRRIFPMIFPDKNNFENDSIHKVLSKLLNISSQIIQEPGKNANYIGDARIADTCSINAILSKFILPPDLHFLWSIRRHSWDESVILYPAKGHYPSLLNPVITDAEIAIDPNFEKWYNIKFIMDSATAFKWKRITNENHEQNIAITIDNNVVTSLFIQGTVENGNCAIYGSFTKEKANEIAALIAGGKMPTALNIVEQKIEN